jgi:hypothetical protein
VLSTSVVQLVPSSRSGWIAQLFVLVRRIEKKRKRALRFVLFGLFVFYMLLVQCNGDSCWY